MLSSPIATLPWRSACLDTCPQPQGRARSCSTIGGAAATRPARRASAVAQLGEPDLAVWLLLLSEKAALMACAQVAGLRVSPPAAAAEPPLPLWTSIPPADEQLAALPIEGRRPACADTPNRAGAGSRNERHPEAEPMSGRPAGLRSESSNLDRPASRVVVRANSRRRPGRRKTSGSARASGGLGGGDRVCRPGTAAALSAAGQVGIARPSGGGSRHTLRPR